MGDEREVKKEEEPEGSRYYRKEKKEILDVPASGKKA